MSIPVLTEENGCSDETMTEGNEGYDGHHYPMRSLQEDFEIPCKVTNQIDRCWKCQPDYAQNRKRLADCVIGFAKGTTGGKHGEYYMVTDPSDNNVTDPIPGTLRHAVIQKEPLWIIFKGNMRITLQQELIMTSNKTIDGRGVKVRISGGAGITIQFVENIILHNIFIQNIVSTTGGMVRDSVDHFGFRTRADGDGISMFGARFIWLDHLSMKKCTDGMIDAIEGCTSITISNCQLTDHNKTILLGAHDSTVSDEGLKVTVVYNHFGKKLIQRLPRVRSGFAHVVNNDYTMWKMYAIGGSNNPTILSQGNVFVASDNPFAKEVGHRVYATVEEWSKWTWCSDRDIYKNGAIFTTSGDCNPENIARLASLDGVAAEDGSFTKKLTRYAGVLDHCKSGMDCSKIRLMKYQLQGNVDANAISWVN